VNKVAVHGSRFFENTRRCSGKDKQNNVRLSRVSAPARLRALAAIYP